MAMAMAAMAAMVMVRERERARLDGPSVPVTPLGSEACKNQTDAKATRARPRSRSRRQQLPASPPPTTT
eukprot:15435695-Alexandrium_andersonii.AAC.1